MAQHNLVEAQQPAKRYTRADFVALRYRLNGLSLDVSARVYTEDDMAARGLLSHADLNAWLKDLQAMLVERAKKANPHLAVHLENAQRFNRWPAQVMTHLIAAGEQDYSVPRPDDTLTEWLKPIAVAALKSEGIDSPGALKKYIEARGEDWYRAVPRIGAGKARTLEAWLRKNAKSLGPLVMPAPPPIRTDLVELTRGSALLPLERVSHISAGLDGASGKNRNLEFCFISAKNDLEAIHAYLLRFREREPTRRAYQKELERFLLFCVRHRGVAMSSALTDDCEAYKAFLDDVPEDWIAPRATRVSAGWRPFAGKLQRQSQRYAVQALRIFFEYLVRVRYLGGNPWVTVSDPVVEGKELAMDIEKAVPLQLWLRMISVDGLLDRICGVVVDGAASPRAPHGRYAASAAGQYRLSRAAILLIGFTGMRREEAATAMRNRLKPVVDLPPNSPPLWELSILGKRKKWRTVMLPQRVIQALKAHWADRGHDFDADTSLALLSPVTPATAVARKKHLAEDGFSLLGKGFTPDGLYQVVRSAVSRMAVDKALELSEEDSDLLRDIAPHALRHTFASQAARKMPQDVLRQLLGHASLNTTSIYIRAERQRAISEYAKYIDPSSG